MVATPVNRPELESKLIPSGGAGLIAKTYDPNPPTTDTGVTSVCIPWNSISGFDSIVVVSAGGGLSDTVSENVSIADCPVLSLTVMV